MSQSQEELDRSNVQNKAIVEIAVLSLHLVVHANISGFILSKLDPDCLTFS